jgi:tRNA (cytidine32/uridine32-2'-O)-methyltransferase
MSKINIVLHHTSHPGNIGATARAMKNMGFTSLRLVNPKYYPSPEATSRSSGAEDLLKTVIVYNDIKAAISDCELVVGASARSRGIRLPMITPEEFALMSLSYSSEKVACVFGNEQAGLSNDEISLCQYQLIIPTADKYSSLNLAMAVQIICYEVLLLSLSSSHRKPKKNNENTQTATQKEIDNLNDYIEALAYASKFIHPIHPKKIKLRIRRLINRMTLSANEVNLIWGFLRAVENKHND